MLSNFKNPWIFDRSLYDWPIELVATNHQMPPVINHKNILKPKMNPHKCKYT